MVGKLIFTFFELSIVMLFVTAGFAVAQKFVVAECTALITGACFVSMCALILVDVWTT